MLFAGSARSLLSRHGGVDTALDIWRNLLNTRSSVGSRRRN
jgi:hypothetical protein